MPTTQRFLKTFEFGDNENPSKKKEHYILSFVTPNEKGTEDVLSLQTIGWASAKYIIEAIDQKITDDDFVRTGVTRFRRPQTATTLYTYKYGRRN